MLRVMADTGNASADTDIEKLFDPQTEQFIEDPYYAYRQARGGAPVFRVEHAGGWIVLGRDETLEVMTDPDRLTSRTNLDGALPFAPQAKRILDEGFFFHISLFNVAPPDHTRFRNFVGDFFSPRSIRRLEPSIRGLAESLVSSFAGSGEAELMQQFALPFPGAVICDLIGIPLADRAQIMAWHVDWIMLQVVPMDLERQVQCAKNVIEYERYFARLVEDRIASPAEDVTTLFAQAVSGPDAKYSVADAVVSLRVMLAAGHETTTGLIGNVMLHLLRDRRLWEQIVADPSLIPAAIEEGLRFDPPIQGVNRVATEDVEIAGVTIPAGSRINPMLGALGRDPSLFEDPDEFRLDRQGPPRHLGFGHGIHFCIGAALARLECRIALEALVELLPGLHLAPDAEARHLPGGITFHRLAALPVVWPLAHAA
jgi:cytochrome P450